MHGTVKEDCISTYASTKLSRLKQYVNAISLVNFFISQISQIVLIIIPYSTQIYVNTILVDNVYI